MNLSCNEMREWMSANALAVVDDIKSGKERSRRKELWESGSNRERNAARWNIFPFLSSEQHNCLCTFLLEMPSGESSTVGRHFSSVFSFKMDVLVPEVAIRLVMSHYHLDYEEAEKLCLSSPPQVISSESDDDFLGDEGPGAHSFGTPSRNERDVRGALSRGKQLQTLVRSTTNKKKDIQMVNFCEMRSSRKRSFKRHGGYVEVAIDTNSSYAMVAEHAADALQLDLEDSPEQHCLKIFRCNGTIVSDTSIPTRFGDDPWTWKGYTSLISKYSSQLKMGVGYVYNDASTEPPPKRPKTRSLNLAVKADLTTGLKVWYCGEVGAMGLDTDVLVSRAEVYENCMDSEEDSPISMDTALPFIPETCYYTNAIYMPGDL